MSTVDTESTEIRENIPQSFLNCYGSEESLKGRMTDHSAVEK